MKIEITIVIIIGVFLSLGGFFVLFNESSEEIIENSSTERLLTKEEKKEKFSRFIDISSPDGFINTDGEEITISEFIGKKVVLLDMWTYSCINCQRTLPFVNDWYKKYENQGLEVIGLHTPEFAFEHKIENVQDAVERFEIKFPVVLDNDFSTWRAYKNRYWPRKYLIDIDGFVVYDHIGEGAYDKTEAKIQELLAEHKEVLEL